ncbi:MAG: hypothetical protein LUH05_04055 [Candidatus Gastranaerophilales bacterium]|nr:hypothetical protein [Candidatus Gastranaerophilales bacterium]
MAGYCLIMDDDIIINNIDNNYHYLTKKSKIISNIINYKCNQPHIFRIKTLHLIYEQIAFFIFKNQLRLNLGDMRLFYNGLTIHFDNLGYYQAEITGSERLTIGERLKLHIKLLRLLKQGKTIKKALKKVKLCRFK